MFKNAASQVICAQLVSLTDGSAVTSGSTTVYILKDGGTQGAGTGTITHEGNGCWSYVPTLAETNADHVAFTFVNTSAVTATLNVYPATTATLISALGGSTITYNGPVADDGEVILYSGADYTGTKSLVWTLTNWGGASVNGEAVTLALMQRGKYNRPGGTPDLEITNGTASQASSTVTVTVAVTSTQTAALLTSPPLDEEHYQLQVRSNTTKQLLVDAHCTVRKSALT